MPSSKFGSKFLGEERYQQYVDELTAEGTIDGEKLSPEERKEGFKKRNDKIGFQDFVEKVLDKKQSATVSKGPTALPGEGGGGALVKTPAAGITKFDPSKIAPAAAAGGGILEEILKIVTSIRDTLIEKNEFDVDQSKKDSQTAERAKRAKKEKGLESGIFKGLAKATEKVLAPVKGMFEKIFDFIKTVILGNIVMNILKWMGDKENKEKIDNLIRFLKDFWPAIVGAYLLFGTKFGALIRTIGGWAVQIIRFAVPKLLRFVTRNPKAAAALAVAGGVGMLGARILTGTEVGADEEPPEGEQTPEQQEAGFKAAQTTAADSLREAEAEPEEEPAKMSKGGRVPGSGNKDTVPAMLTPGEFVMSKGAVSKYGTNTLAAMNSMGGGTNIPSLMGGGVLGFSGGGSVPTDEEPGGRNKEGTEEPSGGGNFLTSFLGGMFGQKGKKEKPSSEETPSGSSLTETQQKALQVLAKYESGAAGYDAVNQIGTSGGRGVKGFSGDIKKMPQHEGRSLTDFTIAEIKKLQYDDRTMSDDQWIESGKLHAVGAYQFIGNTLPGVAQRAGIPDNAKFTPGVQDLMALQLMKERGISPWVGPSDKATPSERAIVEKARSEPIAYDPSMSTGGAIIASASGTALSSTSSSSGASRSVSSSSSSSSSSGGSVPKFDYKKIRQELGVKSASVSKPSRPSSTAAYTQMQQGQQQSPQKTEKSQSPGIPSFDAAAMSSSKKIKTLGITV